MQVSATAKNVRVSPQKVKLVVDQIQRMPPEKAITMLSFVNKSAARPLKKVIASAIANAKNNFGVNDLTFKSILVGKGMVFKRSQPVAKGRPHPILKRTSHITVILEGEQKKKISEVPQVSQVSKASEEENKGKKENK